MADTVAADRRDRTAELRPPHRQRRRPGILVVLAFGFVAAPVFHWARRGVDRLARGHDDPVAVLDAITRTTAADPLVAVATGIRRALALPYVALAIHCGQVVEVGRSPAAGCPLARFPLRYRGRELATLRTVPGSRRTRRLLAVLSDHLAGLVHAALTTHELATSRRRIVAAREAERHELRRDLHDVLGSALIGLTMEVRAARRCPAPTADLLATVEHHLAACGAELRAVLDGLRPPELAGGLIRAVTAVAARMTQDSLAVEVVTPPRLPRIAPQVELVAYRIMGEALANAVRHSGATRCVVRLAAASTLILEVTDNGRGTDHTAAGRGLGLTFMRERATEVGGNLEIRPARPGGTVVRAVLPCDGV